MILVYVENVFKYLDVKSMFEIIKLLNDGRHMLLSKKNINFSEMKILQWNNELNIVNRIPTFPRKNELKTHATPLSSHRSIIWADKSFLHWFNKKVITRRYINEYTFLGQSFCRNAIRTFRPQCQWLYLSIYTHLPPQKYWQSKNSLAIRNTYLPIVN